jgi:hypothetical protein
MLVKAVLVATLLVTGVALADVLRRDDLDASTTAWYLLLYSLLFLLRVAGQVLVLLRAPAWLPPMTEWNLVPYRFLLPVQLAILGVMAVIEVGLFRGEGLLVEPSPVFGAFLIAFSIVYAAVMAVRYAVRMRRRPEQRWFGGAIPITFHFVLAAFLLTWGKYNVSA